MSGFWRKILDKKANAGYSPQAGDWEAMQSLMDKSPGLAKPAGGSSSFPGAGGTFIKTIAALAVGIASYTAYVFLSDGDTVTAATEYYQVRDEVEHDPRMQKEPDFSVNSKKVQQDDQDRGNQAAMTSEVVRAISLEDQYTPTIDNGRDVDPEAQSVNDARETATTSETMGSEAGIPEIAGTVDISQEDYSSTVDDANLTETEASGFNPDRGSEITDEVPGFSSPNKADDRSTAVVYGDDSGDVELGNSSSMQPEFVNKSFVDTTDEVSHSDHSGIALDEQSSNPDRKESLMEEEEDEDEEDSDVIVSFFKRMQFNSVAAEFSYQTPVGSGNYFAPGAGLGLEWRLADWRFQTGVGYQQWFDSEATESNQIIYVDTNFSMSVDTSQVSWVDSAWVVTGLNQGEYRYDTLTATVIDTLYDVSLDSIVVNAEHPVPAARMSSRFSVPLRISYRKRFGSFYADAGAALISNFTTYETAYVGDAQKTSYSLDMALRPALGYQLGRRWSAEVGFNYLVPLYAGESDELVFEKGQQWSLSLGIRYFIE